MMREKAIFGPDPTHFAFWKKWKFCHQNTKVSSLRPAVHCVFWAAELFAPANIYAVQHELQTNLMKRVQPLHFRSRWTARFAMKWMFVFPAMHCDIYGMYFPVNMIKSAILCSPCIGLSNDDVNLERQITMLILMYFSFMIWAIIWLAKAIHLAGHGVHKAFKSVWFQHYSNYLLFCVMCRWQRQITTPTQ